MDGVLLDGFFEGFIPDQQVDLVQRPAIVLGGDGEQVNQQAKRGREEPPLDFRLYCPVYSVPKAVQMV